MPTGYTDGVGSGKVASFEEYALLCARAFGACIMLRDEPLTSDIPTFEPSDYHQNKIGEAMAELAKVKSASVDELQAMADAEYQAAVDSRNRALAKKRETRRRYEAMLEKARSFKAPTPEHEEYAKFLVSQLEESIKWDCREDYYKEPPVRKSASQYRRERIEELAKDVGYHARHHREEVDRTESRNQWVRALKESLGVEVAATT